MKRSVRHRAWKWFWIANFPVVVVLALTAPLTVMVFYTAVISVYANAEASAAAEFAAEMGEQDAQPTHEVDSEE